MKTSRITVRFHPDDLQTVLSQADASCLTAAEFIRRRVLGRLIVPKADLRVLAELRRLGGLLKHIHLETQGLYSADTRSAIQSLEAYVHTLEAKTAEIYP